MKARFLVQTNYNSKKKVEIEIKNDSDFPLMQFSSQRQRDGSINIFFSVKGEENIRKAENFCRSKNYVFSRN